MWLLQTTSQRPLTYRTSTTHYVDAKMKFGGLNVMLADNFGTQNIARGITGYKLDLNTFDAIAEYDIQVGKLPIKPGLNFRHATYDDSNYWDIENRNGFINGQKNATELCKFFTSGVYYCPTV